MNFRTKDFVFFRVIPLLGIPLEPDFVVLDAVGLQLWFLPTQLSNPEAIGSV